jgi:hypothetical protein
VRRLAESTAGEMKVERSVLGGAHVGMWLRTAPPPPAPRRSEKRRRKRRG